MSWFRTWRGTSRYDDIVSIVWVRRHQFSTFTDDAGSRWVDPVVKSDTEVEVDVDLPSFIIVNALVASARGATGYWARQHELRLILCLVNDQSPDRALRLRGHEFKASSGHIRRLISESVGLGLLTSSACELYGWQPRQSIVANFDVLPVGFQKYKKAGVRPDLLYALPGGGYVAGEARGRSSKACVSPPSKAQLKRLNKLLTWSNAHQHPFFMSWSHLTVKRTVVDFFDYRLHEGERHDPRDRSRDDLLTGAPTAPGPGPDQTDSSFGGGKPPDEGMPGLFPSAGPRRASRGRPQADPVQPGLLGQHSSRRILEDEAYLFETAPAMTGDRDHLLDRQLRGAWTHLDLLGPTGTYFFLGVLDRGFTETEAARLSRPLDLGREIEAGVSGRLVAAVTHTASASPPPLSRLEEALVMSA